MQKKPRVWWTDGVQIEKEFPDHWNDYQGVIQVIEKSAYDKAVNALKEIAQQDLKGNRPSESVLAYNVLDDLGEV